MKVSVAVNRTVTHCLSNEIDVNGLYAMTAKELSNVLGENIPDSGMHKILRQALPELRRKSADSMKAFIYNELHGENRTATKTKYPNRVFVAQVDDVGNPMVVIYPKGKK